MIRACLETLSRMSQPPSYIYTVMPAYRYQVLGPYNNIHSLTKLLEANYLPKSCETCRQQDVDDIATFTAEHQSPCTLVGLKFEVPIKKPLANLSLLPTDQLVVEKNLPSHQMTEPLYQRWV